MCFRGACVITFAAMASIASLGCATKAAAFATVEICGSAVSIAEENPPTNIGPVVLMALPCLHAEAGGPPTIPSSYRRLIQLRPSNPSAGVWIPYDDVAQRAMQADFRRLWDTGKLDDVSISVTDYKFSNGVVGKFITYTFREGRPSIR